MADIKHYNFAESTIANVGGIAAGDTSVDVQAGDGTLFDPDGDIDGSTGYIYCVLVDSSANREIIKVTNVSTDTFTIVRAQQGTQARAFAQNDVIELRATAASFDDILAEAMVTQNLLKPFPFSRSIFTDNSAATAYTIKVGSGCYYVKDKIGYWLSELTTTAIGTPSADTWYYLYLDYSAITSGTQITNSELIWSSTAPTFSHSYDGWYNGDDRCIFAVRTDTTPNTIYHFFHDGGNFIDLGSTYMSAREVYNGTPSSSWANVDFTVYNWIPPYSERVHIYIEGQYVDTTATIQVRQKSQTYSGYIDAGTVSSASVYNTIALPFILDGSQGMQVRWSGATAGNSININVNGYYLPKGM